MPIDGVIYMHGVRGLEPLRVRHIEGYCENIHRGVVRVGLTLATVQGTVMQTLIPVGTQCPGLWWKKYHLHRSESSQKERRTGEAIVVLLLLVSAIVYPDPDSIKIG